MASLPVKVDRQITTPFLLKLFYKESSFTPLSDFQSTLSTLPPHITLYTWQTCTLRELAHLLSHSHPELLPTPAIGTRLAFRLIFPDTRSAAAGGAHLHPGALSHAGGPGRFLHQDLGSVVLGDDGAGDVDVDVAMTEKDEEEKEQHQGKKSLAGGASRGGGGLGDKADVMLKDVRFVIGDYIAVAILPPLGNGSVAPVPGPGMGMSSAGMAMGMSRSAAGGGGRAGEGGRDHHHRLLASGGGAAAAGRGGGGAAGERLWRFWQG